MKYLLLSLLVVLPFTSCRTMTPLDPMTMKPCSRCLPGNYLHQGEECYKCGRVEATK